MAAKMGVWGWFVYWLAAVATINWLPYGISRLPFSNKPFDVVTFVFQEVPILGNIFFIIVGIIGLTMIPTGIWLALRRR